MNTGAFVRVCGECEGHTCMYVSVFCARVST
jgi:hypothetical protein